MRGNERGGTERALRVDPPLRVDLPLRVDPPLLLDPTVREASLYGCASSCSAQPSAPPRVSVQCALACDAVSIAVPNAFERNVLGMSKKNV